MICATTSRAHFLLLVAVVVAVSRIVKIVIIKTGNNNRFLDPSDRGPRELKRGSCNTRIQVATTSKKKEKQ